MQTDFSKFVFSRTLRAPPPLHHHHVAVSGQYSRPLLSSSFFWTDPLGPSAHSTFTPRHPMSTYPGAARKRTPVSLRWAVCARLFPWPGRAPPTALAGLHRAQDAGCGYGNGGPPRPRPRARGEDSLVVVSTRCRARRRLEGPPSGNGLPCGESTSSDRRMSYP